MNNFSDYLEINNKQHQNFDFVDINLERDQQLFIDPILIQENKTEWCRNANVLIKDFGACICEAYENDNTERKSELFMHAGEINATKLGYGNGRNGKGNTLQGLLNIFDPLGSIMKRIDGVNRIYDFSLLLKGFGEDRLSDMLTNVLHELLNEFTLEQISKYGIKPNSKTKFWTWDLATHNWKYVERDSLIVNGREVLLVPKNIVRRYYLFSIGQYFDRVVLDYLIEKHGPVDGKKLTKKAMRSKVKGGRNSKYNESIKHLENGNLTLNEFHQNLPIFYLESGGPMTDEQLDLFIYGEGTDSFDALEVINKDMDLELIDFGDIMLSQEYKHENKASNSNS